MLKFWMLIAAVAPLALVASTASAAVAAQSTTSHPQLVSLFADWRAFNHPAIVRGKPDYSAAAMAAKAKQLSQFQRRLAAIDTTGWSATQRGDYRLVEAEMNGLDFFQRVLRPWARDPGFTRPFSPK